MKKQNAMLLVSIVALGLVAGSTALINSKPSFVNNIQTRAAAPTNTRRIWILNNDNWWTDNNFYVHAWNASGNCDTAKVTNILTDYYHGFGYVDVALTNATSSLSVQVVNSWGDYGQTVTLTLPAFGGEDVIWMNSGGTWDSDHNRNDRNASLGTSNGFNAGQLAAILAKYNTCSDSNTYGYNAYPQLKKNFFDKCADNVLTSTTTLADYDYDEYIQANKDYDQINKDHTSTVADKVAGLEYWYNLNK